MMNRKILGLPIWLLVVGVAAYFFRDKLKPIYQKLMGKTDVESE